MTWWIIDDPHDHDSDNRHLWFWVTFFLYFSYQLGLSTHTCTSQTQCDVIILLTYILLICVKTRHFTLTLSTSLCLIFPPSLLLYFVAGEDDISKLTFYLLAFYGFGKSQKLNKSKSALTLRGLLCCHKRFYASYHLLFLTTRFCCKPPEEESPQSVKCYMQTYL